MLPLAALPATFDIRQSPSLGRGWNQQIDSYQAGTAKRNLRTYQDVIGQIGARRARAGIWNVNAKAGYIQDQHEMNLLLARLSTQDRETLANMLVEQVKLGVFESLKVLEQFEIAPFEDGYEGSPFNDFIGRLADWDWPQH